MGIIGLMRLLTIGMGTFVSNVNAVNDMGITGLSVNGKKKTIVLSARIMLLKNHCCCFILSSIAIYTTIQ